MGRWDIRESLPYPWQLVDDPAEAAFQRTFGPWATVHPDQVADVLGSFEGPWWVTGGWAIDAFTGTDRHHEDIDISMFRTAVPRLRSALAARFDLWSAGSNGIRPVDARNPDVHPDAEQIWVREHALAPWLLDIQLNPDERGAWVSRRDRSFVRPLDQVTWVADDGVRYINVEIALIFKARLARPKDEVDLRRALPLLRSDQVDQIRAHVQQTAPEHPWLPLLTADPGRPDPGGR